MKECGPREEEVKQQWRELHDEGIYDLYSSSDVIPETKSRRLRWAGHVACMREKRGEPSFITN